ncbi:MAG: hypothetical protein AAGH92_00890 [Planctomycetota bacterium]
MPNRALRFGLLTAGLAIGWSSAARSQVSSNGETAPVVPDASSVATGGQLVIGDEGSGEVWITSGGSLRTAGITLGKKDSGQGTLEIRGTSALGDSLDDLVLGEAGVGEVRVLDHARLTTGPASDLVIASTHGSQGRLVIDGYASADLGGHGFVNAWHPETPGRPTVSLDQGTTLRFALGNPAGVASGLVGSLALGDTGTHPVTLTAAGDGTLLDVPGVWSLGHAAPGHAELFDGARAAIGKLHLGVSSAASLRIDDATLSADALFAGTGPHAPSTLVSDAHATIQLGSGGLRFGPIPGVTPDSDSPPAPADFTVRGTLFSFGPVNLGGTSADHGHRLRLDGHDASLQTLGELRLGGPTPEEHATLQLAGSSVLAPSASVEPGGTLAGHGTLTLDRQLNVAGTVHASGTLRVEADRLSRFFADATLAVDVAVVPVDEDGDPETPPTPTITHGQLEFTDDARLDGTLEIRPNTGFPNLPLADMPAYEPFVIAQTTGTFSGWFDLIDAPGIRLDRGLNGQPIDGLAVVQTESALIAQRAWVGDANFDRRIDQYDLNTVLMNWGASTESRKLDWSDGDFDGSGRIDQHDLNAILNRWGSAAVPASEPSPIPEPGFAVVLGVLGSAVARPMRLS